MQMTRRGGALVCAAVAWLATGCSSSPGKANIAPVANVVPVVDTSKGQLVRLDGTASTDPDDAITYAWTQTLGPDVGTMDPVAQPQIQVPAQVTTLGFELVVTDARGARSAPAAVQVNVFADKTKTVFVATTGDDAADGSRATPLKTISAGIGKAAGLGVDAGVYVGEGEYPESIALESNVGIYGGYGASWVRAPAETATKVKGGVTAVQVVGKSGVTLDGLTIESAPGANAGESSIAVLVSGANTVTVQGCTITGGAGVAGGDGAPGAPGNGGGSGSAGLQFLYCNAGPSSIAGGTAGGPAPYGGAGGYAYCAGIGGGGAWGWYNSPPAGVGGAGGAMSSAGGNGAAGTTGGAGGAGVGGATFGLVDASGYRAANGTAGARGYAGGGGGGGGAGGGWNYANIFLYTGSSGGGGGAGGQGGYGGGSGGGGGGSFGVVLLDSTAVVLSDLAITTGAGGNGGAGAAGGAGGLGGSGGAGGLGSGTAIGAGGRGGSGGPAGAGGPGGGGGGGPSIAVVERGTNTSTRSNVVSTLLGTGGAGGAGGAADNAGAAGEVAEYKKLP